MPGLDGTGPARMGPMTGGARGWCNPYSPLYAGYGPYRPPYPAAPAYPRRGYRLAYGFGHPRWGLGRGFWGRGWGGRGWGRGRGVVLGVLNRWSVLSLQRRLEGFFRPTVYNSARFYGVGELKRLLRSVVNEDEDARIVWQTTLFPRWWPWPQASLPWGGFIAMALLVPEVD